MLLINRAGGQAADEATSPPPTRTLKRLSVSNTYKQANYVGLGLSAEEDTQRGVRGYSVEPDERKRRRFDVARSCINTQISKYLSNIYISDECFQKNDCFVIA